MPQSEGFGGALGAPKRSKSIDLVVPVGYTGTSIWRVPQSSRSSLGVPGTRGTDLLRPPRSPDFGTPPDPGGYLQNRGFWQNPHIKPTHLYRTPKYPQIGDLGSQERGGRDVRGVPNWRIIKYRPGGAPPDGPQGPQGGPWTQAAPCHLPNMAILAILEGYQIWIPATRSQIWRSEVPGGPVVLVVATSYQCWWWW